MRTPRLRVTLFLALLAFVVPAGRGQQADREDGGLLFPRSIVAVFFDVGGTLTYRDPETRKFAWYKDALPTVEALRESGLRVGLLSNVPRGWDQAMLRRLLLEPEPLDELFEPVVLAQSPPPPGYAPPKPDPLAFQNALAHLRRDVTPVQVLYVGEDRSDVLGARLAGLQATLLVRRGRPPREDPSVIRGLPELFELLEIETP